MTLPPRPPGEDPDEPTRNYQPTDPTRPFQQPYGHNEPPPPYGYAPRPAPQEDKNWVLAAHFGGAAGALLGFGLAGWVVPLIVLQARGQQSPAVRAEAVKALNFQILCSLVAVVGMFTLLCFFLGELLLGIAWLAGIGFGALAGIRSNNNEPYNYPPSVPFIK